MVARREPEGLPRERGVTVHRIPLAGPLQIARNLVGFARGRLEPQRGALLLAARSRAGSRDRAVATGCELVVADMIRTVPLARATGLPMIVDLDDLLSERYHWLARQGGDNATILGYYAHQLPALRLQAGRLDRRAAPAASKRERWPAARSRWPARPTPSRWWPRRRPTGSRSAPGVPVACLPMAIRMPATPADVRASDPRSIVFVGGLDYFPNEVAVRWFASEVASRMGDPAALPAVRGGRLPGGVARQARVARDPVPRLCGRRGRRARAPPRVRGAHGRGHGREDQGARGHGRRAARGDDHGRGARAGARGRRALPVADTGEEFLARLRPARARPRAGGERSAPPGRAYVAEFFAPEVIVSAGPTCWPPCDTRPTPRCPARAPRLRAAWDIPVGRAASSAFETGP